MALLKGRLFSGLLFAGALFGAHEVEQSQEPVTYYGKGKLSDEQEVRHVLEHYEFLDKIKQKQLERAKAVEPIAPVPVSVAHETVRLETEAPQMLVADVQSENNAELLALEKQRRDNELALLLILSEV